MTILPVIKRELRAEARRPFNYWLRVLGAAVAVLVCAVLIWDPNVPPAKLTSVRNNRSPDNKPNSSFGTGNGSLSCCTHQNVASPNRK